MVGARIEENEDKNDPLDFALWKAAKPGVFYFVQLGSGECRPMEERALAFLNTHTDTVMVLDALEYGLGEVPATVAIKVRRLS